jgi:hypothetical protein
MENKYKFYKFHIDEKGKKVVAVTHYAGRTIKGIAKCAPEDTFDIEFGVKLAVARAETKVARAKARNAATKYLEAAKAADAAQKRYDAMAKYYMDAVDQFDQAMEVLNTLEA